MYLVCSSLKEFIFLMESILFDYVSGMRISVKLMQISQAV
jgi:hypothetical protein